MLYIVCAMAYGDCLVTLSQLEALGEGGRSYRILGTGITAAVSALLGTPLPVTELQQDKAAFYTAKESGPLAAIRDLISMHRALSRLAQPGDEFVFEKRLGRNRLVTPIGCRGIYPPVTESAYQDRQSLVRELFGQALEWRPAVVPAKPVRQVLVNPCARFKHRWLSAGIVSNLIAIAESRDWALTLLDPCGQYSEFRELVGEYKPRPSLPEAAALLRTSDLYIGPDSFFVHLAYYYRVPCFALFHPDNLYFQLPGMMHIKNFMFFDDAHDVGRLKKALLEFVD